MTWAYSMYPLLSGPDRDGYFWALPEHDQHKTIPTTVKKENESIAGRQSPPKIYQKA